MNIDHTQLLELVPHRPPILMLDEVVGIVPGEQGTGVRDFKEGDANFEGHFPGEPILPGVLTIETFAQTALVVSVVGEAENGGAASGRLAKVNEMAFLEPILPGMKVNFAVEIERRVGTFVFVDCIATSGDLKIASGKLTLKL